MAIKINGCTVIDDSRVFCGSAAGLTNLPGPAAPTISSCKVCGLTSTTINLSCANYYKLRANQALSISCVCNITCCNTLFIDVAANIDYKPSLPSCFINSEPLQSSKNSNNIYEYNFIGENRWIGNAKYVASFFGDSSTPPTATNYNPITSMHCAGIPVCCSPICCMFKLNPRTIPAGLGFIKVNPPFIVFNYEDSQLIASMSSTCVGSSCTPYDTINLTRIGLNQCDYTPYATACIPACAWCGDPNGYTSGKNRVLAVSIKDDFIVTGRAVALSTNEPCCNNMDVIEVYSLSGVVEGRADLLQSTTFCCGPTFCVCNAKTAVTPNYVFDWCDSNPLMLITCNAVMGSRKFWKGTGSCVLCHACVSSPGYSACCGINPLLTGDSKYVLAHITPSYTCNYDFLSCAGLQVFKDNCHGVCTTASWTTIFNCSWSWCRCCPFETEINHHWVFDCCFCHIGVFGIGGSQCSGCCAHALNRQGVWSRNSTDTAYVVSLPFICGGVNNCCAPYYRGCNIGTVSTFGICNEKCCLYSVCLQGRCNPTGCGACYNPATCTWTITTTAVDVPCFGQNYQANYALLYTCFKTPDGGINSPLGQHSTTDAKLFTI